MAVAAFQGKARGKANAPAAVPLHDPTFDTQIFYEGSSLDLVVPEPGSLSLLASGLLAISRLRRARRRGRAAH